jgi:hypothetical protein
VNQTARSADSTPSERPRPNVPASIGFAIAVAVLWMVTLGGAGSTATAFLALGLVLIGLPLSTRYSFRTLHRLDQHGSSSTLSHLIRKVVVLLALPINAWVIFMVAGYALIVVFSILNGGPIVATRGLRLVVPEAGQTARNVVLCGCEHDRPEPMRMSSGGLH